MHAKRALKKALKKASKRLIFSNALKKRAWKKLVSMYEAVFFFTLFVTLNGAWIASIVKKNTHQNIECDIVDNYVKSENVRGPISDQVLTHVAKKRFFLFKWLSLPSAWTLEKLWKSNP